MCVTMCGSTEIRVLIVSMFLALMSVTDELAVRRVKRARACTNAFRSSSRWKMHAILEM